MGKSDLRRFMEKVEPCPTTGCWLWMAGSGDGRYGRFFSNGKNVQAHRFSCATLSEPIPDGMYVDHVCRNTWCVNPDHLRVVTPRQNALENNAGVSARAAMKTRCAKGHPYNDENTYVQSSGLRVGRRDCRQCHRERERNRYEARMKDPKWREKKAKRHRRYRQRLAGYEPEEEK